MTHFTMYVAIPQNNVAVSTTQTGFNSSVGARRTPAQKPGADSRETTLKSNVSAHCMLTAFLDSANLGNNHLSIQGNMGYHGFKPSFSLSHRCLPGDHLILAFSGYGCQHPRSPGSEKCESYLVPSDFAAELPDSFFRAYEVSSSVTARVQAPESKPFHLGTEIDATSGGAAAKGWWRVDCSKDCHHVIRWQAQSEPRNC